MAKHPPPSYAVDSPWRVGNHHRFHIGRAATEPPDDAPPKDERAARLAAVVDEIDELQRRFAADARFALLLVFQAMDAAGKDSTIRAVFTGVNPAGFETSAFGAPSTEERAHDFLWRTSLRLPKRGKIGVFNRSYYEEVLVTRVHPELLGAQNLPELPDARHLDRLWKERLASIRDHEKHLARSGTVVVKFFLNVSPEEQKQRFLARLEEPEKHWKFQPGDLADRARWGAFMHAYERALRATDAEHAPWYAVPADSKPFMRLAVAEIVRDTLRAIDPRPPAAPNPATLVAARAQLLAEDG